MSTPSLLNIPYVIKAGTLYSQIPETGAGDFAVSRVTSPVTNRSTRVNANGFIELANDNVPRLDYPVGGAVNGCPALLVEPSAANSLFYSEQFDNGYWTKNGTTDQGNVATSPSNTLTADNIYPTTSGSDRRLQRAIPIVSGTTYTSSIFAKANGLNWIRFWSPQFNVSAWFNVQLGTIGTIQAGVTARIENYGNGWYRCSVTQTVTTTGTGQFYITLTDGNNTDNVTASGTNGILFWGAQVEVGSVPTSYIPTDTQAITRGADVINKTSIASLIGQSEGTMYWEGAINRIDRIFLSLTSGTDNSQVVRLQTAGDGRMQFVVFSNTAQAIISTSGAITLGQFYKVAVAYKQDNFVFYLNGAQVGTDTSGTVPTALTQIQFSNAGATDLTNQRCRAVAIYPNRLSNSELIALTTP